MKHLRADARLGLAVAGAAAAIGVAAGVAARMGARGLAVAAEPLTGNWLDSIKAEHLVLLDLLERAEATRQKSAARRKALLGKIKLELTRHTLQEENILYPALRLSEVETGAMNLGAEHAEAKTRLYELEQMAVDDPRWIEVLRALRRDLEVHMQQEETEIFPALRLRLTPEEDSQLTLALRREGRLLT